MEQMLVYIVPINTDDDVDDDDGSCDGGMVHDSSC